MPTEFRILECHQGNVLAQPLDRITPQQLKIASSSRYVENEVIVADSLAASPDRREQWQVVAARIDPSFIGGTAPKLMRVVGSHGDDEYEFADYVTPEEEETFDEAVGMLRSGDYRKAARRLRAFIGRFPYHIDSYHHLGIIEMDHGRLGRALKYFQMGYHIGLLSIPARFAGRLPWYHLNNRPFLRAAHGYGLALERKRRALEAADVYELILSWNPNDNQGIRYLLPSLYLQAKAPQKARTALERNGADGMNLYTRCLLEIQDGRRREAVRWLCRALSYNLHLPAIVLSGTKKPSADQEHVVVGSQHEAAEYLRDNASWLRKQPRDFLQRMLHIEPFARRLQRACELKAALDSHEVSGSAERGALVEALIGSFAESQIPAILQECHEAL